jgi:ectoine hydroxylase-related dioxygenase (phytanoyl-CoA dioxygenase family)
MSQTELQLPALSDLHPIGAEQATEFARTGHTVVPGLASPAEVAAYRLVIAAAVRRLNSENRPLGERDTYGKAFLQVENIWARDPLVERFTRAPRFAAAAAQLLGAAAVRLYHDQALFKEPGGGPTPWHQDQYYWPLDRDLSITMWMPLVDVPAEVGTMHFVSGSHRLGFLGEFAISDESDRHFDAMVAGRGLQVQTHGPLRAGDATFHAGWTLHKAPPNPTGEMREVMTIIYLADGTRVGDVSSEARRKDLDKWLPGLQPGEVIDSPLNPVLYPV